MTDPALEKIVFHFRSGPRKGDVTSFIQAHITIGRAVDSDLVFDSRDDRNVSSHHAVIRFQNQRFGLVDSHSTNGTYINGERLERAILKSGDVIRLGALGPEVEVSIPAETLERTMLDSDQLDQASMTRDSASASKLTDPEVNEKVSRLRYVRFIRNTMVVAVGTAAGVAGFIWTLIEGFELTPPRTILQGSPQPDCRRCNTDTGFCRLSRSGGSPAIQIQRNALDGVGGVT